MKTIYETLKREGSCWRYLLLLVFILATVSATAQDRRRPINNGLISAQPLLVSNPCETHVIDLVGYNYDPVSNTTTFTYSVTSGGPPALSHWILELCVPCEYVVSAGPGKINCGLDPTTGVYGLKFDEGLNQGQTQQYTLVMKGNWPKGDINAAVKAGQLICPFIIEGPDCVPDIRVEKTVVPEDFIFTAEGDEIQYSIVVTNIGFFDLVDVVVNDELLGIEDYFIGDLAMGATYTLPMDLTKYVITYEDLCNEDCAPSITNYVDVIGFYDGIAATDDDEVTVFGVIPEISYTNPEDKEYDACAFEDDDAVEAAFLAWLDEAALEAGLGGGCMLSVGVDYGELPSFCGGEVTVTWTVSDVCVEPVSFSAKFIIEAPEAISYTTPADKEYDACEFMDDDAVEAAFLAWLDEAALEAGLDGGCMLSVGVDYGELPSFCGGEVTVTWTVSDVCVEPVSFSAKFIIEAPEAISYTTPADKEYDACEFMDDDAVEAAFLAWLDEAALEAGLGGGCMLSVGVDYGELPSFCGGEVTVTWTVSDVCVEPVSFSAKFIIEAPEAISYTTPADKEYDACEFMDDDAVEAAFLAWLDEAALEAGLDGGCMLSVGVDYGELPSFCGGEVTVTWTVSDVCVEPVSFSAKFIIEAPEAISYTTPADKEYDACEFMDDDAVEVAFLAWLDEAALEAGLGGGCMLSVGVDYGELPSFCGGEVTVTWTVSDVCVEPVSFSAKFIIEAPEAISYTTPADKEYDACEFMDDDAVEAAFLAWLDEAALEAGLGGGCMLSVGVDYGELPSFCGGEVTVTWTVSDVCVEPVSFSAKFIIEAPEAISYTTPADKEYDACEFMDDDAVEAAFLAWLDEAALEAGLGGGCMLSVGVDYGELPSFCGGEVTVTWTVSDVCVEPVSFSAKFIIEAPEAISYTTPADKEYDACEFMDDDAVEAAFLAWLDEAALEAGLDGGCMLSVGVDYGELPSFCGGEVTVTWTVSDVCVEPVSFSAKFIIEAPEAISYTTPADKEYDACEFMDDDAVEAAFLAWLDEAALEAGLGGGCMLSVGVDYGELPSFCGGEVTVTWTVSDVCVEPVSFSAKFIIEDTTVDMPHDLLVFRDCPTDLEPITPDPIYDNCGRELVLLDIEGPFYNVVYVDNGIVQKVVMPDPEPGPDPDICYGTITYIYYFEDCAGVVHEWEYSIEIRPPVVSNIPEDGSAHVEWGTILETPENPTVYDNCGRELAVTGPVVSETPECDGEVTYVWTYTDCAGEEYEWKFTYIITYTDVVFAPLQNYPLEECQLSPAEVQEVFFLWQAQFAQFAPYLPDNEDTPDFGAITAPDYCEGGDVVVFYTFPLNACQDVTIETFFSMAPVTPLEVSCGEVVDLAACTPYEEILEAYQAWVAGFNFVGDCEATSNRDDIPELPENILCEGADLIFTYIVNGICDDGECTSTFKVHPQSPVTWDMELPDTELALECDEDVPVAAVLTASTNCGPVEVEFDEKTDVVDACITIITRTWTAEDDCGNVISHTQVITIEDTTPPVFTFVPADIELACDDPLVECYLPGNGNGVVFGAKTAVAGCDDHTIEFMGASLDNGSTTFSYRVTSGTSPSLSHWILEFCGDYADVVAGPGAIETGFDPTTGLTGIKFDTGLSDGETRYYYVTLPGTWSSGMVNAAVKAGSGFCTLIIEGPVCDDGPTPTPPCEIEWATATDNCSDPIITYEDENIEGVCPQAFVIERTWIATDACGNQTTQVQTITIYDNVPPVIAQMDDIMLEGCNPEWPAAPTTTWTDNCSDGGIITGVAGEVMTDGCYQYIDYTFNVMDDCGNEAEEVVVRVTRLYDVTAPVIVELDDIMLEGCNPEWPAAPTTTWTDNCSDGGIITGVAGEVMTDGCYQYIDYTFNVMDDCGNEAEEVVVRVTRLYDVTAPVIVELDDIMLEGCNPEWPAAPTTTWTDNCSDGGIITGVAGEVMTDGCYQYIDYTFNVMDDCGNEAEEVVVRVTRLYDVTAPVIVELDDIMLEGCNPEWPAAPTTTWTDNCSDGGIITGVAGEVMTDGCYQYIDYTFNVMDDCGNEAEEVVVRVTRLYDVTAPVIVELDDIMLEGCNPEWPAAPTTTWTDNCSDGGIITGVAGEVMTDGCYQYIDYTFNVMDDCGNEAEEVVVRVTRLYDVTAPVIVELDDIMLEGCNPEWPAAPTTTWTDNCSDGGIITGVAGEVMTDGCYQYIDYTFNVMDDCGNEAEEVVVRVTRLYDVTAPVIVELDDIMLEGCNPEWPAAPTTTWTDNCSEGGTIVGVAGEVITDGCYQYIDYTFNVMDDCGNEAEEVVVRVTRLYDVTAPVIVQLDDIILEDCNADWPAAPTTTWTDNCSDGGIITGVAGEVMTDGCYQYIDYTFNVMDDCGNEAEEVVVRVTRLYDVTAPVIVELDDIMLEGCNPEWPAAPTTTWTDNCSDGGIITGVAGEVMTDGCYQYIDYTFNVMDDCGNEAEEVVVRVTRLYDVTAPVIVELDDIMLEGCNPEWPAAPTTTWTDNCSDGGIITGVAGEVMTDGCYQYIDYTFNVMDDCGNEAEEVVVRVTRLYDVTAPVIVELDDIMLEGCNPEWPAAPTTTWTDNCSDGGIITGVAGEVMTDGCYQYIDYTFNVMDDCGNEAEEVVVRVTRLYDVTAPVIVELDDIMLEGCNPEWPAAPTTTWTDNCSEGGIIEGVPGEVVTLDCSQYIDYTFNVSDDCGNHAEEVVVRVTRIYDVTPPYLTMELLPVYIACGESIEGKIPVPEYADNCTELVTDIYCVVVGHPDADCYTFEYPEGEETEIYFYAVDECGNESEKTYVTVYVEPCLYCSLTQGGYGNAGGKYCDMTTTELLNGLLLANGGLTVGYGNRTFAIPADGAQCVLNILPGGGPSQVLPVGEWGCDNLGSLTHPNTGRLRNNLLAQTIVFQLNLFWSEGLSDLTFSNRTFYTSSSSECPDGEYPEPVGEWKAYTFPQSVWDKLTAETGELKLSDLLELANKALGGENVGVSLSHITDAVDLMNNAFHECVFVRFTMPDDAEVLEVSTAPEFEKGVSVSITPNPFRQHTQVRVAAEKEMHVVVEVYNMQGARVAVLFEGMMNAMDVQYLDYTAMRHDSRQIFMVVVRTPFGTQTHRMLLVR